MIESESERDARYIGYVGTFLKWVAVLLVVTFAEDVSDWVKVTLDNTARDS